MADGPNKRIKLEHGATNSIQRDTRPLPSTPDKHGGVELIDKAICIEVGTGEVKELFDLHKGLLRHYSGFLRTAIEGIEGVKTETGSASSVELPEENPNIFKLFKNWMYSTAHKLQAGNVSDASLEYRQLVQIWCFAQRKMIPMLQNHVIDVMITKIHSGHAVTPDAVKEACLGPAHEENNLMTLLAWRVAKLKAPHEPYERWLVHSNEQWFQLFGRKVVLWHIHSTEGFQKQHKLEFNPCTYHEHEEGVSCGRVGWRAYA